MSKDVDDKIVSLTFKNEQFKAKAAETIKILQQMQDSMKKMGSATGAADIKPTLGALDTLKAKITGFRKDTAKPLVDMTPSVRAMEEFGAKASTVAVTSSGAIGNIQTAADGVDMGPAGESASQASAKFMAFGVAAGAALFAIGAKAVQMAGQLASAFTIDPMKAGFQEFETNMGSIQTILANTDRYGTSLGEVESALDDLNKYSDKTIYNFGAMVKNIGLFTNAGIRIEDATSMIKGFSNAAAASGTNAEQAAGAAYQLSQALSAGKVTLMDWKSLQNAGMGNKNMQQGLVELAQSMGTLGPAGTSSKEVMENFNGSLEKGWLKADVMSNYLKIMAGDLDATEMATLGLTAAQIKWYQRQQTIAEEAATKVRTFTQLMSTVKESIASGWAESFRNVVGNFTEGTALFSSINNGISGMVSNSAEARNKMLKGWKDFGGRNALLEGLFRSVAALRSVLDPIRFAFREMFPKQTTEGLLKITDRFRNFTKGLMASKQTVDSIHRIFRGFFALVKMGVSIIWQLGKMVVTTFKDAFGGATSNGIMPFIASIADVITGVSKFLTEGDRLKNFFTTLQGGIHHVLGPFKGLIQVFIAIGKLAGVLFGGVFGAAISVFRNLFGVTEKAEGAGKTVGGFLDKITRGMIYAVYYINTFADKIRFLFDLLRESATAMKDPIGAFKQLKSIFLDGAFTKGPFSKNSAVVASILNIREDLVLLKDKILQIRDAFMNGFNNPFEKVEASGITGFITNVGVAFGKVWDKISDFASGGVAIFDGIKASITNADWLGMLKDVGVKLKESFMTAIDAHSPSRMFADAAQSIPQGIAEGIRNAWDSIKTAFSDLGRKLSEWWTSAKETFSSVFGDVEFDQVLQGGGLVALLSFVNSLRLFRKDMSGLIESLSGTFDELGGALSGLQRKLKAEALKELAIAIAILTASVLILTFVDPDKLKMALAAIGSGFLALGGTMKLMDSMSADAKGTLAIGAAFLGLGIAVFFLAMAVKMLSDMPWNELATGLGAVAILLGTLVAAVKLMPDDGRLKETASAFLAMSVAIGVMALSAKLLGDMSLADLTQGVLAIGVLAEILVTAANKMTEALPGATALVAAAAAILIIAGAVKVIGEMNIFDILGAVIAVGVLMWMLVGAANAMTTALPGASAMIVVAASILIMAQALTVIGDLSIAQIVTGLGAILGLILLLGIAAAVLTATGIIFAMAGLGAVLGAVGVGLALIGGAMLMAAMAIELFSRVGEKGVDTLIACFEKLVRFAPQMITAFVDSIIETIVQLGARFPEVVAVLVSAFITILDAIDELAPRIFDTLTTIFSGIIQMIVDLAPQLIDAGMTLISSFLISLTSHALEFGAAATLLISQFILGIASNVLPLVTAAVTLITNFLNALVLQLPLLMEAGVNFIVAIIDGLTSAIPRIAGAVTSLIVALIDAIATHMTELSTAGTDAVIEFLGGMASNAVRITEAVTMTAVKVITSIVDGLFDAIVTVSSKFVDIVVEFLNQMGAVVRSGGPRVGAAIRGFAGDLVAGIAGGIRAALGDVDWAGMLVDAVGGLFGSFMDLIESRSPSKLFARGAKNIPLGIAVGIDDNIGVATKAIGRMSSGLVDAFETGGVLGKSEELLAALGDIENLNPVIAPVLDLTQVMSDAQKISGLVDTINPAVSLTNARLISSTEDVRGNTPDQGSGNTVVNKTFVQNNYSPEALSANDIYRNTKSQFAMEKEALESA